MVGEPVDLAFAKLKSEELRRDALEEDAQTRTVIVEVDLPRPRVRVSPIGGAPMARRVAIEGASASSESRRDAVDAVTRSLTNALGHAPVRFLDAAGAFVVDADGHGLSRLIRLPHVVAIYPNTRR